MNSTNPTFIDLFSGCGGLSLGLLNAGWKGLFAIEQNADAFRTLKHNLVDENAHNIGRPKYVWPESLEVAPHEMSSFLRKQRRYLESIKGKVHLVAGGPPCQGFSFAGKRSGDDPRNELFRHLLRMADILEPQIVMIENVQGIDIAFGTIKRGKEKGLERPRKSYAERIYARLHEHGYIAQQHLIKSVDFGVPQFRPRYITLGIRKDISSQIPDFDLEKELYKVRQSFLEQRGLSFTTPVTVFEAISDLQITNKRRTSCADEESPSGFYEIVYEGPLSSISYQKLMHDGMNGQAPNSLRLVNHRPETIARFEKILETCRKGVNLSKDDRRRLGIRKTAIAPLAPDQPSHTLTTLPDDFLHYAEPRVHTVREHARLQSFPDWFEFLGKYTTGGSRRAKECPRYTQVGNAVPPLLAEALGEALLSLIRRIEEIRN